MKSDRLVVDNAVKQYGKDEVLHGVNLSIAAGERVALLGHNGAGKTTLIKLVLGLTALSGGSICVFGHAAGSTAARRIAAYLPETVGFHRMLTGREQMRHFARLAGRTKADADQSLERAGIAHAADRRMGTYSKGMLQRIGLAQILLRRPAIALLDEPTSGLDPVSRIEFYDLVDDLAKQGTAILISSHALTELEARTDRIDILSAGNKVAEGTLDQLRRSAGLPIRVRVRAANGNADRVATRLGGVRMNGTAVELAFGVENKLDRLADIIGLEKGLVEDFDIVPPSLEDLYRHFTAQGQ